jgi:hypothetical protein
MPFTRTGVHSAGVGRNTQGNACFSFQAPGKCGICRRFAGMPRIFLKQAKERSGRRCETGE